MSTVVHSKLAIQDGPPYRTTPFPKRTPFGEEEIALVTEAIQSFLAWAAPK